ncbi:hypothetical protein DPMN_156782 [Dreissena polymorpha]|uniref:Uncharacterized protein n=1 Tax=Dreissena polymorpha TaxID=45954 RepID=A0A9D4FRA5_DREPO|nr:hypothetical protein DPMN_156782 [Dreissena polymorpha]
MIEVDVDARHALIHRAVLIHVILMIIIDHHGNDTRGDVLTVVAVLAIAVVAVLDHSITGIKIVDKLH